MKIFEIDENSLIFYNINKHAICGHFFDFNREKYFYLSNSGLGCNNHFTYTDKNKTNYILPKIYKIQYNSQLTNLTKNFVYIRNTLFGELVGYTHKPAGLRTEYEQDKFNNIKIFLEYIKTNIMKRYYDINFRVKDTALRILAKLCTLIERKEDEYLDINFFYILLNCISMSSKKQAGLAGFTFEETSFSNILDSKKK